MKPSIFLVGATALVAIAGCNAKQSNAATAPVKPTMVQPPKGGNWTDVVNAMPSGGFMMGNPNAKVKLVEYGSMTCPHCRRFDQNSVPHLLTYVKSGQVSWEFRNYVRDAFDIAASLVARCNGTKTFFPVTRAIFADQESWENKIQGMPQDQFKAMQDLPPNQQFVAIAKVAGFPQFAAAHGVPVARSAQCLSNVNSVNQLVQMASDATTQYPDFGGTPTFIMNGTMVDLGHATEDQVWPTLKSKLDAALHRRR
jgi:protein-disulfide isomerase